MRRSLWIAGWLAILCPVASAEEAASSQTVTPAKMTFAQVIERALAQNPEFALSVEDVHRAEALVTQARAGAYPTTPTLYGNASGFALDHARESGGAILQHQFYETANITLTVPIVSAGKWAETWRALDDVAVTKANAADVRRQVALTVGRAYLAVLAQHRLIEVDQIALQNAKEHYAYAHDRLMAGVGTRVDDMRAQQEMSTIAAQVETAYAGLARLQEAVGVLLAMDGPVDTADEPTLPAPADLQQSLADAREDRTDLRALNLRRETAEKSVGYYWADYVPLLSVVFAPFQYAPSTTLNPTLGYIAELTISIPFYDGGLRQGQQREREALAVQSKVTLENALRQTSAEVRSDFETVRRNDVALRTTRDAALLARKTLELTTQAYKAGAITNIEVIDAERAALDADNAVVQAEDAARQARLDMLSASGRFPEPLAGGR